MITIIVLEHIEFLQKNSTTTIYGDLTLHGWGFGEGAGAGEGDCRSVINSGRCAHQPSYEFVGRGWGYGQAIGEGDGLGGNNYNPFVIKKKKTM